MSETGDLSGGLRQSPNRKPIFALAVSCLMVLTFGCEKTPTGPDRQPFVNGISVSCRPGLDCLLLQAHALYSMADRQDITSEVEWSSSDRSVVTVSLGRLGAAATAVRPGDAEVLASWKQAYMTWTVTQAVRVVPGHPPLPLQGISGSVKNTGNVDLVGARVQVQDGLSAGEYGMSEASGYYSILNVLPGDCTLRATMDGYQPVEHQTTVGFGSSRVVDFILAPSR